MSDRELLELAAKAADIELWELEPWREQIGREGLLLANGADLWNPLTDGGDALRLAVKLGIQIHQEGSDDGVAVWADQVMLWADGDTLAATRRAIVTAAAARNQTNTKD